MWDLGNIYFLRGEWAGDPFWGCSLDFEISGLGSLDSGFFNWSRSIRNIDRGIFWPGEG